MIIVRAATRADATDISELLIASITMLCGADHHDDPAALAAWLANKTPAGVRKWLASPDMKLFVAERDSDIAAVGAISTSREIGLNYVLPAHRFACVSKVLLKTMEVELGPGDATLTSTATAHRFYRRMGWRDVLGVEGHAPSQLRMHKRL